MTVQRIVPDLAVADTRTGHDFYTDFLGLEKAFAIDGVVMTFRCAENPAVQVNLVTADAVAGQDVAISVGVPDADRAHAEAQRRGYEIAYPLTDEPWGVRRFFVRDPHGHLVNVVAHRA